MSLSRIPAEAIYSRITKIKTGHSGELPKLSISSRTVLDSPTFHNQRLGRSTLERALEYWLSIVMDVEGGTVVYYL